MRGVSCEWADNPGREIATRRSWPSGALVDDEANTTASFTATSGGVVKSKSRSAHKNCVEQGCMITGKGSEGTVGHSSVGNVLKVSMAAPGVRAESAAMVTSAAVAISPSVIMWGEACGYGGEHGQVAGGDGQVAGMEGVGAGDVSGTARGATQLQALVRGWRGRCLSMKVSRCTALPCARPFPSPPPGFPACPTCHSCGLVPSPGIVLPHRLH